MKDHVQEHNQKIATFLMNFRPPGAILAARVAGSRGYNLHREDSDWDFAGIYASPPVWLLSMSPPPDTYQHDSQNKRPGECDYTFYEVGKWVKLLCKGTPNALETLFATETGIMSRSVAALAAESAKLVAKTTLANYFGFAEAQLTKAKNGLHVHTTGGRPCEKWFYHLFRLIADAKSLIETGTMQPYRHPGEERDRIMMIRNGDLDIEKTLVEAERALAEARALDCSHLPDSVDRDFLDGWLKDVRLEGCRAAGLAGNGEMYER